MLPHVFDRLPRGLKVAMIGVVIWLLATIPLALYLLLSRWFGEPPQGPGIPGALGFALNVVGAALVAGGVVTWLLDERRGRRARETARDDQAAGDE